MASLPIGVAIRNSRRAARPSDALADEAAQAAISRVVVVVGVVGVNGNMI